MIRLLVAFLACAGVALCAADFSGSWKGDVPRNGRRDDFSLTLIQDGQQVSGLFAFDRELRSAVSIERPELRNDELTFEIHDMDGQLVRFRIRPVADKLAGDVTVGSEVKRIEIAPAVYRVGRDVTAPVLINKVEPRPAKVQGAVDLAVEISPDGRARNIRVSKSLGPQADENAIECVKQWKFLAGRKGGVAVTVPATIEVNFRNL